MNTRGRLRPAFVTTIALSVTACDSGSSTDAAGSGGTASTSVGGSAGAGTGDGTGGSATNGGSAGTAGVGGFSAGTGGASAGTGGFSAGTGGSSAGTGGSSFGGSSADCPTTRPLMNDPCTAEGISCQYPSISCADVMSCVKGRWKQTAIVSDGICNPPPPCPDTEPKAGDACTPPTPGGTAHGCRYPHMGCFTYWDCGSTVPLPSPLWVSAGPKGDGCCPSAAPAASATCGESGVQCTYASEVATCAATGWTVGAPVSNGAGGAGGAGAAGNAGAGG